MLARSAPLENLRCAHLSTSALSRGTCTSTARSAVRTTVSGAWGAVRAPKNAAFSAGSSGVYRRSMAVPMHMRPRRAALPLGPANSEISSRSTKSTHPTKVYRSRMRLAAGGAQTKASMPRAIVQGPPKRRPLLLLELGEELKNDVTQTFLLGQR